MFGGLELKGPVSSGNEVSNNEKNASEEKDDGMSSAFSFLQQPATTALPAMSPPVTTSGFSFMSDPTPTSTSYGLEKIASDNHNPENTESSPNPNSGFSFMSSNQETAPPAYSSGFDLSGLTMSESAAAAAAPPPSAPLVAAPPSDILEINTQGNSEPAGSGITFGTSTTTVKKTIKKTRRGKKIGTLTDHQQLQAPRIPTYSAAAVDEGTGSQTVAKTVSKDEAEEAVRKAEDFMREKTIEDNNSSFNPPVLEEYDNPISPTVAAAEMALEEAKAIEEQKKSKVFRSNSSGIMAGLGSRMRRNLPFFERKDSSLHGLSPNVSVSIEPEPLEILEHHPSVSVDFDDDEAQHQIKVQEQQSLHNKKIQIELQKVEQDRIKEQEREEELLLRKIAQEKRDEENRLEKLAEEEKLRNAFPGIQLQNIFDNFHSQTKQAMKHLTDLRSQQMNLKKDKSAAENQRLKATQQIAQAELQQTKAAENEDFDLADELSSIIETHTQDLHDQSIYLDKIELTLSEMESQKEAVLAEVQNCFTALQSNLSDFHKKQDDSNKFDSSDKLKNFAENAKRLSAENDRLNNELKHIVRDESIVTEERTELEVVISEQCEEIVVTKDETADKLTEVNAKITKLKEELLMLESEAKSLTDELEAHETIIMSIRSKFSRQLTRVSKKEKSVNENRREWDSEKNSLLSLKDDHEKEVEDHSNMLLDYEKMMSRIKTEKEFACTMELIIASEVVLDTNPKDEKVDNDVQELQAKVLESEGKVEESERLFQSAEEVMGELRLEIDQLDQTIPFLEDEKKYAAKQRDFKAAAKASKKIKDAKAKREKCEDQIENEALDRLEEAKGNKSNLELVLKEDKEILLAKEKITAIQDMKRLAERIQRLEKVKQDNCGNNQDQDDNGVTAVSAWVLQSEIDAIRVEGETLGEIYGDWEEILNIGKGGQEESEEENEEEPDVEPNDVQEDVSQPLEEDEDDEESGEEKPINHSFSDNEEETPTTTSVVDRKEAAQMWIKLKRRIEQCEEELDEAVEKEDYDVAADLDETIKELTAQLQSLDISEEVLELLAQEQKSVENEILQEEEEGEGMVPSENEE